MPRSRSSSSWSPGDEAGAPGLYLSTWSGLWAPKGTPKNVTAKLNAAFNAALNDPEVRSKLRQAGVTPSPSSPEEFARYLRDEIARWGKLIREKGIKGE